jgi:hypothetical protein
MKELVILIGSSGLLLGVLGAVTWWVGGSREKKQ